MDEKNRQKRLQSTLLRHSYLESKGYKVESIWECEYKKIRACDSSCKDYSILPNYTKSHPGSISTSKILTDVQSGEMFGMLEVDIHVPNEWKPGYEKEVSPYEYFKEMSPIFCTTDINMNDIGEHMLDHVSSFNLPLGNRRLLVGGMKARKILLATPLLKWYLDEGLEVTRIYQTVEFNSLSCFSSFVEEVSAARRLGDISENMQPFGETMKLIGNSSFGSCIMNRELHNRIVYTDNEYKARLLASDSKFRKMSELNDVFEVEMEPLKVELNLPLYLGYFILQYAKKRMLEFAYQFLKRNLKQDTYMYLSMDTDSAYYALSTVDLRSAIKTQELVNEYDRKIYHSCNDAPYCASIENWFPRKCCPTHRKYDRRTPGLFKLEAVGHSMISLCSKTYVLQSDNESYKFSCKGLNKRSVKDPFKMYSDVLCDQINRGAVNRGVRLRGNILHTYKQERKGLSYFYCKRKVLHDGVSTIPLDITLTPWNLPDRVLYTASDVLGNEYECNIVYRDMVFNSVREAYFHIMRDFTTLDNNSQIINETDLSDDWMLQRDNVMQELLRVKIALNEIVLQTLKQTGSLPLVYIDSDSYWSVNIPFRLATVTDQYNGRNRLSFIWEFLRCGLS